MQIFIVLPHLVPPLPLFDHMAITAQGLSIHDRCRSNRSQDLNHPLVQIPMMAGWRIRILRRPKSVAGSCVRGESAGSRRRRRGGCVDLWDFRPEHLDLQVLLEEEIHEDEVAVGGGVRFLLSSSRGIQISVFKTFITVPVRCSLTWVGLDSFVFG